MNVRSPLQLEKSRLEPLLSDRSARLLTGVPGKLKVPVTGEINIDADSHLIIEGTLIVVSDHEYSDV